MSVSPIRIAARLDYATLDELEAGFAERVGEHEVFLAHGSFGSLPDEPRVGASVVVEITTAGGETALALEGVIAWAYPSAHVPAGREPGTGIAIDRLMPGCEARMARMRKRGGAGVRVRPPGSRIKAPTIERARPDPVVRRPLPASLFEAPAAQRTPPPVQPAWHAPAPRVMGLALERAPDAPRGTPAVAREDPAAQPASPPPPVPVAPAAVALDGLPDLPSAAPTSAFEQVPTDVDLLRSVDDAPRVDDLRKPDGFERRPLVDVAGPRAAAPGVALVPPAVTMVPLGDEPQEAADEPLVVSDEDVSPVDEDSTGSHEVPTSNLPSLDAADFHTAEHAVVASRGSSAGDWEARTEHSLDVGEPTAEASDTEASVLPPRPLPPPAPWPTAEALSHRPVGIAFMVARRTSAPVGLEVVSWPATGTKRVGALDEARAQGGDALDQAIAQSAWLARDAAAPEPAADAAPFFDPNLTDPGHRVVDVVGAAVEAAEREPDEGEVFSEREGATAAVNPALDERTVVEEAPGAPAPPVDDGATVASDDTHENIRTSTPLLPDDELETDRALQRPPTEASSTTRNRLGVLQRFLGKR